MRKCSKTPQNTSLQTNALLGGEEDTSTEPDLQNQPVRPSGMARDEYKDEYLLAWKQLGPMEIA